jgi:hypothetical protein
MGWRQRYNAAGTEEWAREDVITDQASEAAQAAYARAREATLRLSGTGAETS